MIRLSVTDLDSYLYWKATEDMGLAELLSRLLREEPPTPAMQAGRAFHTVLENAGTGSLLVTEADGFTFTFAIEQEIALPSVRELKAECLLETPAGPVTLVGKVDALNGLTVHDYKLTERFDAERYADSYQWRSYLTMFGARQFVYDVFVCHYDGPEVRIYDYHRFPLSAYPGMREDVLREVSGLAEIVAKYVPEKIAA
jgi:hypothetical protein